MTATAFAPDLEKLGAVEVLEWAYGNLPRLAIVASFQAESIVLIDLAAQVVERPEVITLDTGRLPQETHDLIDEVRRRWPIRLTVVSPHELAVQDMVARHGTNLFRESVELRHLCCDVRKTRPLDRALNGYAGWITGLRRGQSASRAAVPIAAPDASRGGILKLAPLAAWSHEQVWRHLDERRLPVHALYAHGYTSIGCASCTRATLAGEDERAGRWWWEQEAVKECGLHRTPAGLQRAATP
jgi:phosphoadenosine phosphosulfate reductase